MMPDEEYTVGRTTRKAGTLETAQEILDVPFLLSIPSVLLAIQTVCTFMGLIIAGSWLGGYFPGLGFFIFTMSVTCLSALSLLVTRTIKLHDLLDKQIPWEYIMAGYSGGAMLLVLIASCIMVEQAKASSSLKAAGIFGLFAWNALLVGCVVQGRDAWLHYRQYTNPPSITADVYSAPPSRQQSPSSASDFSSPHEGSPGDWTGTYPKPASHEVPTPSEISIKRPVSVYSPTTETWAPL